MRNIKTLQPAVTIFILGIPPRLEGTTTDGTPIKDKIDQLNELIKTSEDYKAEKDFWFISNKRFFSGNIAFLLEPDQVHLNEAGLKNVVRLIHDRVLEINRLPRNKNRKRKFIDV